MTDADTRNCTIDICVFCNDDYLRLKEDKDWLRKFEAICIMKKYANTKIDRMLELGCGNGIQSCILSDYCFSLISTDANQDLLPKIGHPGIEYLTVDAQDLSRFPSEHFDFIFSSNCIEHLPRVDKCLEECRRVLKDGGIVVHTVPNATWKTFNLLLFYPVLFKSIFRKQLSWAANSLPFSRTSHIIDIDGNRSPLSLDSNLKDISQGSYLKRFLPEPHGINKTHINEFLAWRQRVWLGRFEKAGFSVRRIVKLPFYYGYGNNYLYIHRLGNKLGLSSSTAYELTKTQ